MCACVRAACALALEIVILNQIQMRVMGTAGERREWKGVGGIYV